MLKRQTLFTIFCAAACAAPLAALLQPDLLARFAPNPGALTDWQRGLDLGLLLLALLAWRLNQNRLVVAAIGLGVATAGVIWSAASGRGALDIANFWLLAAPSGLGLSLLPRDGTLSSGRTGAALALLLAPAAVAWAVGTSSPADAAHWLAWPWTPGTGRPSLLATLSLALFALCAARRLHVRVASAWLALGGALAGQAALAWGLGLAPCPPLMAARIWLASSLAAGACFGLGLFLLYWQRVYLDELTGVPNRRALDERLSHLEGPYSLAMVDIDHFKSFNDTYGHAQGDEVLRLVAAHLSATTGARAYRYGGEEFCVLATDLDSAGLGALMDSSRGGLQKRRFTVRQSAKGKAGAGAKPASVQVTVSVGVAQRDRQHPDAAGVLKLADEGLYDAKNAGRNNVVKKN